MKKYFKRGDKCALNTEGVIDKMVPWRVSMKFQEYSTSLAYNIGLFCLSLK